MQNNKLKVKKVLIAVSSTGGHIYPGLSVGNQLKKDGYDVVFVGKKSDLISKEGFKFYPISAIGFQRKFSFKSLIFFIKFKYSVLQSLMILSKEKPDIVIGFGGYISFPVILAAWLKKIPSIIHEQKFTPGLANKISAKFANKICVGFKESENQFSIDKVVFSGNPVRENILNIKKEDSNYNSLPLTCFIFGGSQGSHGINTAIINLLDKFLTIKDKINFIHIAGENDFDIVKKAYMDKNLQADVYKYLFCIERAYQKASIAVCRSGAMTITELIALKIPAILIPYPYSTENHQKANAELLTKDGCAVLVEEKNIDKLAEEILNLVNHPETLAKMSESYNKLDVGNPVPTFTKLVEDLIA